MVTDALERVDELVPVKQLLRWQDDGGALPPDEDPVLRAGAAAQRPPTAPVSTTATAQLAP